MKTTEMQVTPDQAAKWLRLNTHNRTIRSRHVDYLADEILNGRWILTHQGIALNHQTLIDGQHRLLAIVKANKSVPCLVTVDAEIALQDVIDGGAKRTVADQLNLNDGLANANLVTGACRTILLICTDQDIKLSVAGARRIMFELGAEMDLVIGLVDKFRPARRSWVVGCLAFALHADADALQFVESFFTGENISGKNPAKAARDWITNRIGYIIASKNNRLKCESLLNAVKNSIVGIEQSSIKPGVTGKDYFISKKRKLVAQIRAEYSQQIMRTENKAASKPEASA